MVPIQLLLPTTVPDVADPQETMAALALTRSELTGRFAGPTRRGVLKSLSITR